MGFVRILCRRVLPPFVLAIAIFVGWIFSKPMNMGVLFSTMIPVMQGHLPPTIFGHGRMAGTPPVPPDMIAQPRPAGELFLTLPGGKMMPQSGLGMCCRASAYDDVLVRRTVTWYLLLGGRHIDGAHLYLNHRAVGQGIRDAMERGVRREEIFVTTKLFPTTYGYNSTLSTVPTFLDELGLSYVDLVLMHAPISALSRECRRAGMSSQQCLRGTWLALSELRERGVMRNVGVSNFEVSHLKEMQAFSEDGGLAPIAVNQFQWNVFSSPGAQAIYDHCVESGIAITAYYSLGSSFQRAEVEAVETLREIAAKHDQPISAIMLRWSLQKGVAVIPGSGNPEHMKQNLNAYSFTLDEADMEMIDELRHDAKAQKLYRVA